jgi:hypothetical protein
MCNQEAHITNLAKGLFKKMMGKKTVQQQRERTFFLGDEVTKEWIDYAAPLSNQFGKYEEIKRAMKLRMTKPLFLYDIDFISFAKSTGIQALNYTANEIHEVPSPKTMRGALPPNQLPAPPWMIIGESLSNDIFHRLANMLFRDGSMECPYHKYPKFPIFCEDRKEECKHITNLKDLPLGCRAWMMMRLYFGQAEDMINEAE